MKQLYVETGMVCFLLALYTVLWAAKRNRQRRETGIDPDVFQKSSSILQRYMIRVFNVVRIYTIAIIVLHALDIQFYGLFRRFAPIDSLAWKVTGFGIGIVGLSICLAAQIRMARSWRVGIDEQTRTELITEGLYRYSKNPTYLGLFLLNAGVWLIWPTMAVFVMNFLFVYTLDIQVRCEEDFLEQKFGTSYVEYKKTSKRYVPFIY